jgi:hypothetical protein
MLLSADADGRPRASAVTVLWDQGSARVRAGHRSVDNAAERPLVKPASTGPARGALRAAGTNGEVTGTESDAADSRDPGAKRGGYVTVRATSAILHVVGRRALLTRRAALKPPRRRGEQHLADVAVVLDDPVRLGGLVHREPGMDHRVDGAGTDQRPTCSRTLATIAAFSAPAGSATRWTDRRPLRHQRPEVEFRLATALQPDDHQPATVASASTLRAR